MTLNEQLIQQFNDFKESVRKTDEYRRYYELISTQLSKRVAAGDLTELQVNNVPNSIRYTLCDDLIAQGLSVYNVNGHRLDIAVKFA